MSDVAPYPWDRLTHLSRRAVSAARRVGRLGVGEPRRLHAFEHALSSLLGSSVRLAAVPLRVSRSGGRASVPADPARGIHFQLRADGIAIVVDPEPALSAGLLGRLLGRPIGLVAPDARFPAELRGALAALAIEAARDPAVAIEARAKPEPPDGPGDLTFDATVLLDERPYRLTIAVYDQGTPTGDRVAPIELAALGTLRIRLSIVAAVSMGSSDEVGSLRTGDVWFPGDGWFGVSANGHGDRRRAVIARAALGTETGGNGIAVGYLDREGLVLRGDRVVLGVDAVSESRRGERMDDSKRTLQTIALEAPIVVRVEVGSVTLTAAEWAHLEPGDIIETGVSLGEPAVLRVAGQEVARGELVSIDGEVGVRIIEVTSKA